MNAWKSNKTVEPPLETAQRAQFETTADDLAYDAQTGAA